MPTAIQTRPEYRSRSDYFCRYSVHVSTAVGLPEGPEDSTSYWPRVGHTAVALSALGAVICQRVRRTVARETASSHGARRG